MYVDHLPEYQQHILIGVGAELKYLRLRAGFYQKELFEMAGLKSIKVHQTLSKYEQGTVHISLGTYFALMTALRPHLPKQHPMHKLLARGADLVAMPEQAADNIPLLDFLAVMVRWRVFCPNHPAIALSEYLHRNAAQRA